MRRALIALVLLLGSSAGAYAVLFSTGPGAAAQGPSGNVAVAFATGIAGSEIFPTSLAATGGVVGTISGSGSCTAPWSLVGADAGQFQVSGNSLETGNGSKPVGLSGSGSGGAFAVTVDGSGSGCAGKNLAISEIEVPGPSPIILANPWYKCTTNYYVSTTGNDSTGNGSSSAPWATLSGANSHLTSGGGICVNVAPGTYDLAGSSSWFGLSVGGIANTPTGYVTYRCETLDGCDLLETATTVHGVFILSASYVWLDGFKVDGNFQGCSGVPCATDYNIFILFNTTNVFQHLTNNDVVGGGGGGVGGANTGDCGWLTHNQFERNAYTNGAEESGATVWEPNEVSGVTSCGDGNFHFDFEWNISDQNMEGPSIADANHTDADGIIMDTFNAHSYTYQSLVANNVAYGNGGFCVGTDGSKNVTFANNTCYDNFIDASNPSNERPDGLSDNGGTNNTFLNNVVYAVPGAGILADNFPAVVFQNSTVDTFTTNIFYGAAPQSGTGTTISCTTNECATNPDWVTTPTAFSAATSGASGTGSTATITWSGSQVLPVGSWINVTGVAPAGYNQVAQVTASSAGSVSYANATTGAQTTAGEIVLFPSGGNFALQSGSPAIGYGTAESYLSAQDVDAGACYHALSSCP